MAHLPPPGAVPVSVEPGRLRSARMAQWMGQFSGKTHASKVAALEASLCTAVKSLARLESDRDQARIVKAVHALAQRLLSARLHLMKSRVVAATERLDGPKMDALKAREAFAREAGVDGILVEFGLDNRP